MSRAQHPTPWDDHSVLDVHDVAMILKVPERTAYEVMASPGFPRLWVSDRALRVTGWQFREWLTAQGAEAQEGYQTVSIVQRTAQRRAERHAAHRTPRPPLPDYSRGGAQ